MGFNENLLKGRVVENIFELMFRETGKFDIIPLGYEHVTPELAQYHGMLNYPAVLDNIRHLPDYVLVSLDKKEMYLVEVKYLTNPTDSKILEYAEKILSQYDPVFLFLATAEGFYIRSCEQIKENGGKINKLTWIKDEIQEKYLKLLIEFIM